nr:PepSY domain-containing protein [Synergistes sp.]
DIIYGGRKYDVDVDALTGSIDEYSAKGRHSAAVGDKASAGDISEAEAKRIALSKVPGAAERDIIKFRPDYEHGRKVYECDIIYAGRKYEVDVDALTGSIDEYSAKGRHSAAVGDKASAGDISAAEAKRIALSKVPGATERDIVKFDTDFEHGRKVYECDIIYGGRKYDVDVDAVTGKITKWEADD